MLTDKEILILAGTFFVLVTIGVAIGLGVYAGYIVPNMWYGDYVVLSTVDSNGQIVYLQNNVGVPTFVTSEGLASPLQLLHGSSTQIGQIKEGSNTSFELFNPRYGAYLLVACKQAGTSMSLEFSTTSGSQFAAVSDTISHTSSNTSSDDSTIPETGPEVISGLSDTYTLRVLDSNACNPQECTLCATYSSNSTIVPTICCNANSSDSTASQKWTITKVMDKSKYVEFQ